MEGYIIFIDWKTQYDYISSQIAPNQNLRKLDWGGGGGDVRGGQS